MPRLPSHHVKRPRLVEPCLAADASVVVVEAAAGYGKTVFGRELVDAWGAVPIEVVFEERSVSAALLASRLRAAVARAGFTDAAEQMAAAGEDAPGSIDALLGGLDGEHVAIVLDDVHHASRDAVVLIDRLAAALPAQCRLVLLARRLPDGLERLGRAGPVHLGAAELALHDDEALTLCRRGFGLEVSPADITALEATTGGWTAAVVLAASRARRSSQGVRDVALAAGGLAREADPVAAMLEEVVVALGAQRRLLGTLASLPLLDEALVGEVTGDPDLFTRALGVGLPLSRTDGGWWELPGPVRERLRARWPADPTALPRAARHYEHRGELALALRLLFMAHEFDAAATLLGELDALQLEHVDALELLGLVAELPDDWPDRHPRAILQLVRACGVAGLIVARTRLIDRLNTASGPLDADVRRGVDAELALEEVNRGHPERSEALGREVYNAAPPDEWFTRARALSAVGYGLCARREQDGRVDITALGEAADAFDRASATYRERGCAAWIAGVAAPRAMWTELALGRARAALDVLDDGLAACLGRPRRIARLLVQRSQVNVQLGRFVDAELDLDAAAQLGRQLSDSLAVAGAHWGRMGLASYRGDADAVVRCARDVEAARGDWWSAVGAEFLADAADCHDRVDLVGPARELLDRALAEPHRAERWTALAEGALLARHGDPELAEERLSGVDRLGVFPRDFWRVTLLRAYAAWRAGLPTAAALASRAFEEAGTFGLGELPLLLEHEVAMSLLALAVEAGSDVAAKVEATALPLSLRVLGRFDLTRGGRSIELSGRPAQLLKLVVARGGRVLVEQAIESLWPGWDPATSGGRLRTVLFRLRDVAPEAVLRDGEVLVLGPQLRCDLLEFDRDARRALALVATDRAGALAWARSAIARYRGDLLPDDPYEDWANAPREATRTTMLDLLDFCAEAALDRGDLDEARRTVQRTIELAPYEDDRYLRVAQILKDQGRRGAALSMIRRAQATLDALGVELPDSLRSFSDDDDAPSVPDE